MLECGRWEVGFRMWDGGLRMCDCGLRIADVGLTNNTSTSFSVRQ